MSDHATDTRVLDGERNNESESTVGGSAEQPRGMSFQALRPFLALTFGLSWGIVALLILFGDQIEAIFGELGPTNPVYILAVYSPAFAAVLLVWRHYGVKGLRSYFRRLTLWRMPGAWWVFLLVGIPTMVYVSAAITGTITDFPFSPWYAVLPAVALALVFGPIEEFGWRGLGLPLLQRRFAPLWAGMIIGIIWALWHVPTFLLSGSAQSSWSFIPFFLGVVAVSVILTPMFNAARGSILIAALFHFQAMNPAFPDADPWDKLVFVFAAVAVVLINRKRMLTRAGAVTDVLMPADTDVQNLRAG